jgi:hypothetical protein
MRSAAPLSRLALAVAVTVPLVACESTLPDPLVEVRVAHAATGLGSQLVLLDASPAFEIQPLGSVFFPSRAEPRLYEFRDENQTAGVHATHETDLTGIILMNAADPTAYYFPLERRASQARLLVVNGVFTETGAMVIRIEASSGAEFEFETTLAPGDTTVTDLTAGSFRLLARPAEADEFVEVQPFSLVPSDNGFLVLVPHPSGDPETPYTRMLF